MTEVVVITLSSCSAGASETERVSRSTVVVDWMDTRDALDPLAAFVLVVFLGAGFWLVSAKNGQSGERL